MASDRNFHVHALSLPTPSTIFFFLDVQKAYDTVWRNKLWKKPSKHGKNERMWRTLKTITECYHAREGELSDLFKILPWVPQRCTLSSTLFHVFINDVLTVVHTPEGYFIADIASTL